MTATEQLDAKIAEVEAAHRAAVYNEDKTSGLYHHGVLYGLRFAKACLDRGSDD